MWEEIKLNVTLFLPVFYLYVGALAEAGGVGVGEVLLVVGGGRLLPVPHVLAALRYRHRTEILQC